jgi:quercetin dioxygenase-like cupin family protein
MMYRRTFIFTGLATAAAAWLNNRGTMAKEILHSANRATGFVVKSGAARLGKSFTMKGVTLNTLDVKISGEDTEGAVAVFEQTGHTPNGGPPLHIHDHQDEWFYVVEGSYRFKVGDDTHLLGSGDTIFLPRAVPHAFIQLSNEAKVIVTYQPAGLMEGFFKTTDAWKTPPAKEEVASVFEAHGMRVVGPPLK